jgi:hypothetical protein
VLVDSGDVVPKEVANPQHTPHPSDGANHIVREEFPESHPADACDDRRKRTYDRNELGEHDCHAPVLFFKFVGADSMLLVEEKAVFPIEDPRARGSADPIAQGITYDCSEREGRGQLVYVEISMRGEQSGGDKQRIAGQEDSDEESRLRKNYYRKPKESRPLNEIGKIRESVK